MGGLMPHSSKTANPAWLVLLASLNLLGQQADKPGTVSIAEIQAGIEAHIEEQVARGQGSFQLDHGGKPLRLKLVRVHTEYLSHLGGDSHFACVDLADQSGDVYDVDFFLAGRPGDMRVTETSVHKINGQPYYVWNQKRDGTWHRLPLEKASEGHFGVVRGRDSFEFIYWARLPQLSGKARMWVPVPSSDAYQQVERMPTRLPGTWRELRDQYGNLILFGELGPADSRRILEWRYRVTRLEKSAYQVDQANSEAPHSSPEAQPGQETFKELAVKATHGRKGALQQARALYDHVIDHMRYMRFGEGWGKGDASYACDAATGNCTDFHAYFIALAQSIAIPCRFSIGVGIPADRDEGGIDGYHCWAEFQADERWWPVDISEGDKYTNLATYYFGHHPANRLELSRGRNLVVDPLPASGPINFLAYPLLEVEGNPVRAELRFSFKRTGRH